MKKIGTMMVMLVAFLAQVCLAGQTSFSYSTGSPLWSYIAQGAGTVSPNDGWVFSLSASSDRSRLSLDMIKNVPGEEYQWWYINLQNSNNMPLTNGFYLATRWPFQEPNVSGFSWYGNGRANNTLTAQVNISEIQYTSGSGDVPTSLALDFVQFEETWGNLSPSFENDEWASGSLRFNSEIAPNVVPEPNVALLLLVAAMLWIAWTLASDHIRNRRIKK